jgi:4-amino-4-deoxy-L-arabinose transferase-like glycosyltransferase
VRQLLLAGVAMVAGAGWWIALVTWWPGSTPFIGGSTDGTELQLAFGYNGLGRLLGTSAGSPGNGGGPGGGGPGGSGGFGGATGLGRLFRSDMATEISWLLPTALLALAVGLWLSRRAPRTDLRRAGLVLLGGSLLVTAGVFSQMKGVIHPYYTVALAPLIAGTLAVTTSLLWEQRHTWTSRLAAAALLETTVVWDLHLLGSWQPAVKVVVVLASVAAVTAMLWSRELAAVGVAAAVVAALGGSTAYAVSTASHPHTGSIPSSGPTASALGGPGNQVADSAVVALLKQTTTQWAAAASSAMGSAPLALASGKAVIALGGFNGGDDAPTLTQFQQWVAAGKISYYVGGGGQGGGPGRGGESSIATWVAAHYTATTVGSTTLYDLRKT